MEWFHLESVAERFYRDRIERAYGCQVSFRLPEPEVGTV